ncbi:hypothetical protein Tco_0008708 [Tanacetum coccineum]
MDRYILAVSLGKSYDKHTKPTIRVVAIIAEGVPESDTKELISYARLLLVGFKLEPSRLVTLLKQLMLKLLFRTRLFRKLEFL